MSKKTFYITIISLAIIGFVVYAYQKKQKGSDKVERADVNELPENLKGVFNKLKELNIDVTTNKVDDNPSITFKTTANGINYAVIFKKQGEVLIYDNISGTPYRLLVQENTITNSRGQVLNSGKDITSGILNIIDNKDYL